MARPAKMARKTAAAPAGAAPVVTTIALPPELYRRLKMAALDERRPAREMVAQAVGEFLDRRDARRPR
jgi:predicted transcriptional regulator